MGTQTTFSANGPNKHYLQAELEAFARDDGFLRFVSAGSLDGLWYWDLENPENEWMSPEFWATLGIDPATRRHDPSEWQDLIFEDDLAIAVANFERHCVDPGHPYDQIVRYRHADGSTVWVRCRGLAVRNAEGQPIRMLGAHQDVTPLKLAEESALQQRALADRANEDLRAFAYATSHDLKSPTNTLRMLLTESLRAIREGDVTDALDLLDKAERTNAAMGDLVDGLLDYTQVAGGREDFAPVDLNAVVSDVTELLSADLAETGGRITCGDLGTVQGSDWQLRRMMQNLLGNAIKFHRPGHPPDIRVLQEASELGRLRIIITDNGLGIGDADRDRVFELFSKLRRNGASGGAGLGLALCSRIAEAHGSRISLTSTPGKGSSFSFQLKSAEASS